MIIKLICVPSLLLLSLTRVFPFSPPGLMPFVSISNSYHSHNKPLIQPILFAEQPRQNSFSVYLEPKLSDDRVTSLFAWISRAFSGDENYDNLMLAMAAIFGTNLPPQSDPIQMVAKARSYLSDHKNEEVVTGARISRFQREQASLGAMGAGQWLGQYKTRPHALLNVSNMTTVDEWMNTLPRGCKRTLKKALDQNFTVASLPIRGNHPAPHSSLAHFRCVVEHEVRLITTMTDEDGDEGYTADDVGGFFNALSEAVSRYIGTTRMTGEIREYRNSEGKIIAFAHEVTKGRTIRGQWFYASDEAAKSYVWFHSVYDLVKRAVAIEGVDTVDLGPSGSDSFSDLKARYGFISVDDWPSVADYNGPFWNPNEIIQDEDDDYERNLMFKLLQALGE